MSRYIAVIPGGAPWGFRLQGGRDTGAPLTIAKVNPNSKATRAHINVGDVVESINGAPTHHLDNKDAINLVHSTYGDLELVLAKPSGLMNGSAHDNDNMSTTSSTTKTTIIKPDPSASKDDKIELDGVTLQGFAPSNVSVVKTTTTKITKITRSRSPSPSPQPGLTQGTISFVGGEEEPVRQSGDGMPAVHTGSICFSPPSSQGTEPIRVVNGHTNPNKGTAPSNSHRSVVTIPRLGNNQQPSSWKPVDQPQYRSEVFSPPPPVPPSPTESLDVPPIVPPKPKVTKTNITLSANQGYDEIEEPPPPRILEKGQMPPSVSHQPKPNYNMNNNDESWPAPPPPVMLQRQEAPIAHHPAPAPPAPPSNPASKPQQSQPTVWSPPPQPSNQPSYQQPSNQPSYQQHSNQPSNQPSYQQPSNQPSYQQPSNQPSYQPVNHNHNHQPYQDGSSTNTVPRLWSPADQNKPIAYKPVNRQPRPSVEGASDSSTKSNDDPTTNKPYQWNPPPSRTVPQQQEVYRPINVTEQYKQPPPASEQLHAASSAPQQFANRPAPESNQYPASSAPQQFANRPAPESNQYPPPPPPNVRAELTGQRSRTASDPTSRGGQEEGEPKRPGEFTRVPNGHVANLPRSVSPTVTLLQYQREDDFKDQIREQLRDPTKEVTLDPVRLPQGALYQTQTVDGDLVHTDTYYAGPKITTRKTERKIVEAPSYDGIGPRDEESGVPLGLRQHVKENNRHDWYKEMFKSIHKRDEEDDEDNKYMQMLKDDNKPTVNHPGGVVTADKKGEVDARWDPQRYAAQPRSIEKYQPGSSSLAAREKTPDSDMYNPAPEPITAAQFGKRTIEPLKREIRRQVEAAPPGRTTDDIHVPRSNKEPPIGQSKPQASTLPRLPKPRSSGSDSGLSAAERLGIKSPPPQRNPPSTPNASQKEHERVLSGGDRLYNYRNPPSTVDKATAERLIEEERKKRKLLDRDNQHLRRHSDFNPVKSPIITNDRFNDLLGEPPKVADKPIPKWKQEVKACALALYSFKAQTAKELSFSKGDTIYLRRDIDKNWYEGEHHGSVGIFPKAYVEVVTTIDEARQAMLTSPSTEGKARAKYKFKGETQLELSFNKGDIIDLIRRIDNNWWDAKLGSQKGIVPASYVDVIREPSGVVSPGRSPVHSPPINSTPTHSQVSSQDSYQYPMGSPSLSNKPKSSWDKDSYSLSAQPERIQPTRQQPTQSSAPSSAPVHVVDPRGLMQQLQDKYKAIYPYMPMNDDELELEEGDIVLVMEKCDDGWFVGTSTRTHMFGTFPGNYVEKI